MKITITGDLGSGKSSVAKKLCQELRYIYISTGQFHREIASEYGVNALELNELAETDRTIDERVDSLLIEMNEKDENAIIDSRMGWHFVKEALKIYLQVDQEIGVERILLDKGRHNEPKYQDQNSARKKLMERKLIENKRFQQRYNVDCSDLNNYDVIVNTTLLSITEVADLIIDLMEIRRRNQYFAKFWIPPKLLYPTEHVRLLASEETKELRSKMKRDGFDFQNPVQAVLYEGFYFIWNGHKRVSAALLNDIKAIPVEVIAKNDGEIHEGHSVRLFVSMALNKSWYYDWEDAHKFHFYKYPDNLFGKEQGPEGKSYAPHV